ncbi:MAG: DUF4159 domain-containing protein [Myxococcales bacterium]|nr:DUF4159 domain-containing protein [Myxococcales bacterium]
MKLSRRHVLAGLASLASVAPGRARAFGDAGAFHPRVVTSGGAKLDPERSSAPARWAYELVRRTSAPGRLSSASVAFDQPAFAAEPFAIWAGASALGPLSGPERRGLDRFLKMGGVLVVDDLAPASGAFGESARREVRRVLPELAPVELDPTHVVFKSYYIVDRPVGRVQGPARIEALIRGKYAQVFLLRHDLLGALARSRGGGFSLDVDPGGVAQREQAIRLAVNIAMYVLCSDYKDDQVHAPWLMRRRARRRP